MNLSNAPLVSVLVGCYNHSRFVIETLESVRCQTYPNIQLIIWDDKSGDQSPEMIRNWIENHKMECKFLEHSVNRGLCKSLNEALSLASGKYIAMTAADDLWLPEKIARQVNIMESSDSNVGVVYSDVFQIDEQGNALPGMFIQSHRMFPDPPTGSLFDVLWEGNFIPAMSTLIRRECYDHVGNYDEDLCFEDWDMWLRISRSYQFAFDAIPSAKYRVVATSMVRTIHKEMVNSMEFFRLKYLYRGWLNLSQVRDTWQNAIEHGKLYPAVLSRDETITILNRTIADHHRTIADLNRTIADLNDTIGGLGQDIHGLEMVVDSAVRWQKRSWFKRAFHKWRPVTPKSRISQIRKLERSIRKRRNRLLGNRVMTSGQSTDHSVGKPSDQSEFRETPRLIVPDLRADLFVPIITEVPTSSPPVKAICFYLPQFHPIPENNEWWGEGFTEWTNVRPAKPQFEGHYQPHVPGELGYYNLLDEGVQARQVELAKLYGIGGFCFYFYWFHGQRLLEAPVLRYVADLTLDLPFCLCWANENWSRRWDGSEQDILMAQDHTSQDDLAFIEYISIYLKDSRYIRVGGKPLILLYRPSLLPNIAETAHRWRVWCRENGIGEIYLAYTQSFDKNNPADFGFDAAVEFPPNNTNPRKIRRDGVAFDESFAGKTYDICSLSEQSGNYSKPDYKLFRSVCPSWDNTARKKSRGTIFCNGSPSIYLNWLRNAVRETLSTFPKSDERLIFINAWNEWAEGAHLEPDQKYGYAWLDATRRALVGRQGLGYKSDIHVLVIGHDAHLAGAQIVLLSLLREWSRTREISFQIILGGNGVLRDQYEVLEETLVLSDFEAGESRERQLKKIASQKIDVVLSSTVTNGRLLEALRSNGLHAPVVTYSHELQKSIERWAGDGIMELTVGHSGRFIAGGTEVGKNLISTHNVPESRLDVVHGFVDVWDETRIPCDSAREKLAAELGIQAGDFVVFGCGTTDWRKGPDLFLSIAEQCCSKSSKIKFVWIGGDSEEYNELVAKTGFAGQIRFLPNALESRRYYYIGHLFLLSSREDPFPLVALEAADAGLPVICFENSGGMPRFVGDDAGMVVPFEDVAAAAAAILALASDDDKRRSLGMVGRERVRAKHSTPIAAIQVAEILKKTCGRGSRREPKTETSSSGPLVSVIVPNYNHEKYLPQRLASIANQTFSDFEIILLDDASTDNSLDVLRDFASREPRARLIPNDCNSGSTFKQWRKGFKEAKGRYIWIAESDDSADPALLARLVGTLESDPDISLACCQLRMMDPQGKMGDTPEEWVAELDPLRWKSSFVNDGRDEIRRFLSRKNTILNASGVVFRNLEGVESLADESMRLCADWLFWARLLAQGKIAYHSEPLNHWRLQTSNARTRPAGELEWKEGRRVVSEIAEMLNASPYDRAEMLSNYRRKCEEWLGREIPVEEQDPVDETPPLPVIVQKSGWCPICESDVTFSSTYHWLRDHYLCSGCQSIPRERAIMHEIERLYPDWRNLVIHECSPGNRGVSVKLRAECGTYIATQYDPAIPFGRLNEESGYQSEDLENQTFGDSVFDLVVTQDVMEHIFDAAQAFKEVHRTLKPGGAHIFTTPLVRKDQPTQQRALRKEDGEIAYLHPAEFHGNPVSPEGSLVTWHWGFDMVDVIRNATGAEVELVDSHSVRMGIEGEYLEVVCQKKAP